MRFLGESCDCKSSFHEISPVIRQARTKGRRLEKKLDIYRITKNIGSKILGNSLKDSPEVRHSTASILDEIPCRSPMNHAVESHLFMRLAQRLRRPEQMLLLKRQQHFKRHGGLYEILVAGTRKSSDLFSF